MRSFSQLEAQAAPILTPREEHRIPTKWTSYFLSAALLANEPPGPAGLPFIYSGLPSGCTWITDFSSRRLASSVWGVRNPRVNRCSRPTTSVQDLTGTPVKSRSAPFNCHFPARDEEGK